MEFNPHFTYREDRVLYQKYRILTDTFKLELRYQNPKIQYR
jgi:hypothetical protein